jgi:co-chaperonin GroES (HSP10)
MIQPLRDNLIAVPREATDRVGALFMPANSQQALRTHFEAKVIGAGPDAVKICPVGSVIHVSESWGQNMVILGKQHKFGRLRDINGVMKDGKLQPVGDRVLCREIPMKDIRDGIVMPENFGKDVKAEVLAVGEKVTDVKPGDHCYVARRIFATIRVKEEKLILVNESNISAIEQTDRLDLHAASPV